MRYERGVVLQAAGARVGYDGAVLKDAFESLIAALREAVPAVYGDRLWSLALYGSVARGTMRSDSDVDLLIVAEPLPKGRMPRAAEFEAVEKRMAPAFTEARRHGVDTFLSGVFKTRAELEHGNFLFLDMPDEARVLYDCDACLASYLAGLAARLKAMGAERIPFQGGYYWRLTPTFKPGDKIELSGMTADELVRSDFGRARKRRKALEVLFEEGAFADVVRESQELVELVLKGMLRAAGVDPPKWHDVGDLLLANAGRLPDSLGDRLDDLAQTSRALRKERELASYGDVDFIPDDRYDRETAAAVLVRVDRVLDALTLFEAVL